MPDAPRLITPRLILRPWQLADREPFAQLNADPQVMTYLPRLLTPEQSDALADRLEAHLADHGFGFWAVELKHTGEFIGFIGLETATFEAPFTPIKAYLLSRSRCLYRLTIDDPRARLGIVTGLFSDLSSQHSIDPLPDPSLLPVPQVVVDHLPFGKIVR